MLLTGSQQSQTDRQVALWENRHSVTDNYYFLF